MQATSKPPRNPTPLSTIRATQIALDTARKVAGSMSDLGARSVTGFEHGMIFVTSWRTVLGNYEAAWCEIPADLSDQTARRITVRSSTGYEQPYRTAPTPQDLLMAIASLDLAALAHASQPAERPIPFARPRAMRP